MITEQQILDKIDNYKLGFYCRFIDLGHVYSYLIDSRLNIFRNDKDKWAIVAERLGYSPRGGGIEIEIFYFGNCLINLEPNNNQETNYYLVLPIDLDNFNNTTDGERLKKDAKYWSIRGRQIELSHNPADYHRAGIQLKEYEPGEIYVEEAGRLLITKHRELFKATDDELYKSIPRDLQKIFVIDEWYHRDFSEMPHFTMSDDELKSTYDINKNLLGGAYPVDYETFVTLFRQQEQTAINFNQAQWEDNRPSAYETWQMIAKVISTGDISFYEPTLAPNTHWKNWPDSGSM